MRILILKNILIIIAFKINNKSEKEEYIKNNQKFHYNPDSGISNMIEEYFSRLYEYKE